jgi:hypothetical protein
MRHRVLSTLGVTFGILFLSATMILATSTLMGSPSLQPEPNIGEEPIPPEPYGYIGDQPRTIPKPAVGEQPMFGYVLLIYVLAAPFVFWGVWREMPDEE